jgi:serine phosphatase RsbU (regulator of sigma subunit)
MKKKRRIPLAITILVPVLLGVAAVQGAAFGASVSLSRDADYNDAISVDKARLQQTTWKMPNNTMEVVDAIKEIYETVNPEKQPETEEEIRAYSMNFLPVVNSDLFGEFVGSFPAETLGDYADYATVGFFDEPRGRFVTVYCQASGSIYNPSFPGTFDDLVLPTSDTKGIFYGAVWHDDKRNEDYLISGRAGKLTQLDNTYWLIRHTSLRTVYSESDEFVSRFLWVGIASIAAMAVLSFLAIELLLIHPVRKLSKTSDRYVKAMNEGELLDQAFQLDKKHFGNEITTLNDSLYVMQGAMLSYSNTIREGAIREQKAKADLALAEKIQASMVPGAPLIAEKLSFYGKMHPAKEVGGDFFSYFQIDEARYGFYIADVSGKGVPAALFMAKAATVSRLLIGDLDIEKIGEVLAKDNTEDLFVTGFFAVVDTKKNELHYVNCGHEPVYFRHKGEYAALDEAPNLPLGCLEDYPYVKQKIKLEAGDALFLYTDGLSEAMNPKGDIYGKEAILRVLNENKAFSGNALFSLIDQDVASFVSGAEQSDDTCFLFFEYSKEASTPFSMDIEGMGHVSSFVDDALSPLFAPDFIAPLQVVLDEMVSNIVHYSNAKTASISLSYNEKEVNVTLCDDGTPFDPTAVKVEKDEDEPGGFGILLTETFASSLTYRHAKDNNLLSITMKK